MLISTDGQDIFATNIIPVEYINYVKAKGKRLDFMSIANTYWEITVINDTTFRVKENCYLHRIIGVKKN